MKSRAVVAWEAGKPPSIEIERQRWLAMADVECLHATTCLHKLWSCSVGEMQRNVDQQ
ncbi:hypothetical protein HDE80_003201 [Rhodanobacter sp. A1T4]|jgi:hypothetical protein|nr:hypothetical protein [Rhodanobacter sp. A1T4]